VVWGAGQSAKGRRSERGGGDCPEDRTVRALWRQSTMPHASAGVVPGVFRLALRAQGGVRHFLSTAARVQLPGPWLPSEPVTFIWDRPRDAIGKTAHADARDAEMVNDFFTQDLFLTRPLTGVQPARSWRARLRRECQPCVDRRFPNPFVFIRVHSCWHLATRGLGDPLWRVDRASSARLIWAVMDRNRD